MNELTKREFIATELMKALVSKYTLNKPEDQRTLAELSFKSWQFFHSLYVVSHKFIILKIMSYD